MEEKTDLDYSKLFPFASVILILFGISKLILFYSFFNVNILSFLEFGEIVTSFLDTVVGVVFIIACTLIQFFLRSNKISETDIQSSQRKKEERVFTIVGLIISLSVVIYIVYDSIKKYKQESVITFLFLSIIGFWIFAGFRIYKRASHKITKHASILLTIILVGETFLIGLTYMEFRKVRVYFAYEGTTIYFDKSKNIISEGAILKSDSSKFYIGNTKNYIFIYSTKERLTSVLPMSSVIRIDFPSKNTSKGWSSKFIYPD